MKAYVIADFLAHLEKEYLAEGQKKQAEAIHEALSLIRRAGYDDDDPISEPARGHLFPLMKRAGMGLEDLKEHLRVTYGIHSTKAIPWGLYEEVCQWLIAQGNDKPKKRRVASPSTDDAGNVESEPATAPGLSLPRISLEWGAVG